MLLPAYDDAAGVTAAFDKNLLTRINRELGGRFDLDRFRHLARWNDAASRIEMHLESTVRQDVAIDALGLRVSFEERETIHTESSIKYDLPRVDRLLADGVASAQTTYYTETEAHRFGVHFARAISAFDRRSSKRGRRAGPQRRYSLTIARKLSAENGFDEDGVRDRREEASSCGAGRRVGADGRQGGGLVSRELLTASAS